MSARKVFDIIPPKEYKETAPPAKPPKKQAFAEKLIQPGKVVVSEKAPKNQIKIESFKQLEII